ncbi:cisplatin damage response ATP-dependent DNA ligase [Tepidamorphus sp. 3E244]|uniref:cisplatin damage response ATP-dependent DNA ligase n=1 Tax=Tepidamorphus sp. 3E244 TaxID=3385498 RepID=UPI0038FBF17C
MRAFANLIERLILTPQRNGKLRLLEDYFHQTPDPDRGFGLAALTGTLDFRHAKPGLVRALVEERVDPILFRLSYDYVGDLSEAVSLIWPKPETRPNDTDPPLADVVAMLDEATRATLPGIVATMLDRLDETGRWAFLKLITGGLRVGVSARLAKTALARMGEVPLEDIEEVWHGQLPPFEPLFAWVEGKGPRPENDDPAPFRPVMLAQQLDEADLETLDATAYSGEWKWDGIRVQATAGTDADGRPVRRLYSRTGDDISGTFPDLLEAMDFDGTIDGELLVLRGGAVQPFNDLQKRLNRKQVTKKMLKDSPAHIRAYDLLMEAGEDLRELPFAERRARLERFVEATGSDRIDLSAVIAFDEWSQLAAARAQPQDAGAGHDADAVEGVMLKHVDSRYEAGRPKGPWFKWKRDPFTIDAVMLYAQRGHGRRSSLYSDYTFGVWRAGEDGEELVPVGKAYSGFTDQELRKLDKYVRDNTIERFGPVRSVRANAETGLVLEVAFEGLNESTRHKSGIAMRFPRISRIRWDKPSHEADRIETLQALLPQRKA